MQSKLDLMKSGVIILRDTTERVFDLIFPKHKNDKKKLIGFRLIGICSLTTTHQYAEFVGKIVAVAIKSYLSNFVMQKMLNLSHFP